MRAKMKYAVVVFLCVVLSSLQCASPPRQQPSAAVATDSLVVASHPIAADIGLRILNEGGNAVDAAVAAGLALGVVDQFNSGIGGGGFIVIRMAGGAIYAVDGRETAPAAAQRDMFIRDGKARSELSTRGPLAVGVPGILAAYDKALELAGMRELGELIEPSIPVAEDGFELDEGYIQRYAEAVALLREDPASARIYFDSEGNPLRAGDILRQPDLASTYRNIRDGGSANFYHGEFAQRLADYMEKCGGLITRKDMASYSARVREPIIGSYRDCEIVGMAPPSSGGIHVLQLLNMVEASGVLEGKNEWDSESIYWVSRFMSKAFEDRAAHLGDPDFYPVPVERLISKVYAEGCVREIYGHRLPAGARRSNLPGESKPSEALRTASLGTALCERMSPRQPASLDPAVLTSHTTNLCVVDRWGNAVAINQTVNLTYGAKITLPGTGVILNNEMDDFSAQPGVPNAFGLIGSEANSIAPGKRPLSSMAPTIVVRDGRPILVAGGAGGPVIITAVFETIVNVLDFEMELPAALSEPRFHHQYKPDVLIVEDGIPFWSRAHLFLKTRKPVVRSSTAVNDTLGRINAIAWDEHKQAYMGAPDPR